MEARAIADTGGDGDHGRGDQSADYAGQRAFHPGADDHDARFGQPFAILHQAVDTGDADVVNGVDLVTHHFSGDLRFFGDGQIAGAGAHYGDFSFASRGAIAPESHGAGRRKILGVSGMFVLQASRG